jgi:hypothetical protein
LGGNQTIATVTRNVGVFVRFRAPLHHVAFLNLRNVEKPDRFQVNFGVRNCNCEEK